MSFEQGLVCFWVVTETNDIIGKCFLLGEKVSHACSTFSQSFVVLSCVAHVLFVERRGLTLLLVRPVKPPHSVHHCLVCLWDFGGGVHSNTHRVFVYLDVYAGRSSGATV